MPPISFLPFLQTVPLATRLLTLTLLIGTISAFAHTFWNPNASSGVFGLDLPWLVLVPGESWRYPWTLLTAGFVELSIVELIVSLISLPLASRYLERIWSPRELIRFTLVTIIGSNVIAFGFSWLTYFLFGSTDAWEGMPYHGLSGLQTGFLVAFTQLIPEHQVQLFGKFKLRVKTLPGLYLLLSNILVILLGPSPYILVQFGFFVSWVYLRFYKLSEDGLSRGDRSETFAFQYWFPPVVRPVISKGANFVHGLALQFKLVPAWDGDAPTSGGSYAMLPGPGGARAEAERRRALALKALDARLASGAPAPSSSPAPTAPASTSASVPAVAVPAPAVVKPAEKEEVKKEKE